jgi:hypothetical protein
MAPEIELGMRVKDQVSGFTGIVTGIAQYLFCSNRALVETNELKDGKPVSEWFDIARLVEVET